MHLGIHFRPQKCSCKTLKIFPYNFIYDFSNFLQFYVNKLRQKKMSLPNYIHLRKILACKCSLYKKETLHARILVYVIFWARDFFFDIFHIYLRFCKIFWKSRSFTHKTNLCVISKRFFQNSSISSSKRSLFLLCRYFLSQ